MIMDIILGKNTNFNMAWKKLEYINLLFVQLEAVTFPNARGVLPYQSTDGYY